MQAAVQEYARAHGYAVNIGVYATSIGLAASTPTACSRKFRHWCLDGTRLDRADVAGIIVGGCIFVILVFAGVGVLTWWLLKRRNSRGHTA